MINVLFFGMIKDMTGNSGIEINGVSDTNELIHQLNSMFPKLTESVYVVAVNRDVIQGNTQLRQDAEVALLPPFSGG
jgi:molybdopterin synthase sulfur carrier subunit